MLSVLLEFHKRTISFNTHRIHRRSAFKFTYSIVDLIVKIKYGLSNHIDSFLYALGICALCRGDDRPSSVPPRVPPHLNVDIDLDNHVLYTVEDNYEEVVSL